MDSVFSSTDTDSVFSTNGTAYELRAGGGRKDGAAEAEEEQESAKRMVSNVLLGVTLVTTVSAIIVGAFALENANKLESLQSSCSKSGSKSGGSGGKSSGSGSSTPPDDNRFLFTFLIVVASLTLAATLFEGGRRISTWARAQKKLHNKLE